MKNRFSSGIIPVHVESGSERYLLLRCFQYWDFPKGGLKRGESPQQAALRELEEETGLSKVYFRWGEDFIETKPYAGGKVARYYLAVTPFTEVELRINPEIGRAEHHEYRWCSFDEATQLVVPRVKQVLEWAHLKLAMKVGVSKTLGDLHF